MICKAFFKRVTSFIFAGVVIGSALTACGNTPSGDTNSTTTIVSSTSEEISSQPETESVTELSDRSDSTTESSSQIVSDASLSESENKWNQNGHGNGEAGGPGMGGAGGGMATHTGVGTTELSTGWNSFTYTYQDDSGETKTLDYAVYIPDTYDGNESLPLITYIGDATYVGSGVASYAAGECPTNWISDENMKNNPSFFLVIGFTESGNDVTDAGSQAAQIVNIIDEVAAKYNIDTKRLYLTGQSMGGIIDFSLNYTYPEKFAATVFVGCQPGGDVGDSQYNDIIANADFSKWTFVYIASALDPKSPSGQTAVMEALDKAGVSYGLLHNMDYQDISGSNTDVASVLAKGYSQNFFQFTTVTGGSTGSVSEHMESFWYSYELNAIYEWLMQQTL